MSIQGNFQLGQRSRRGRAGFTLLEALLASTISLFLLGGLYVVVDLQVFATQNSRDAIAQATLARALMDRIARDMVGAITINNPGPFRTGDLYFPAEDGSSSSSSSSNSGTGGATGASGSSSSSPGTGSGSSSTGTSSGSSSSSGTSGSSGSGSSASGGSGSSSSSTSSGPAQVRVLFIPGVVGYQDQLTAFQAGTLRASASTSPAGNSGSLSNADTGGPACDIKRVTYWVPGEGLGLARWESSQVSSPESVSTSTLPTDVEGLIIAPEVRSITFSYNDGTPGYWTDFWDSRSLSYDSSTPQGPPRAVKIEVEMVGADGKTIRRYSQVVALPTANSVALGKVVDPGASASEGGSSDSSGSSTSGTSSSGNSGNSSSKSTGSNGSSSGSKSTGGNTGGGATNTSGGSKTTGSTGGSSGKSK